MGNASASRPCALITGGVRRVGLAIARAMARANHDLVLTTRTPDAPDAAAARAALEALGARVFLEPWDPERLETIPERAAAIGAAHPTLSVLVHNASVYERSALTELTPQSLERHARINAFAPALLTRALAPVLASHPQPGAVVAMADIHVLGRPRRDMLAYSMSKAALVEMVQCLARELAPKIRVNAVAPGVVAWPDEGPDADPQFHERYLQRVPLARSGTPDEAAEAVRWLALDATYVTGEVLRVDGGRWLT